MRTTRQFSITLPNEMADAVKAKVKSGEYATESEVIREGLRALLARDRAVESWLRTEVAAAYDEARTVPESLVDSAHLRRRLTMLHEQTMKERS
ncbi:MAG: ribbon-helix-helix domain-containing protein [Wenzhouxiangellaceae bacterium]